MNEASYKLMVDDILGILNITIDKLEVIKIELLLILGHVDQ